MQRSRLFRLMYIVREVKQGRYPNAHTLSRDLEVSARTIHRDLELLRDDFCAPLEFDRRRKGFYLTDPEWTPTFAARDMRLGAGEALALVLGLQALESVRAHGLEEPFQALLEKLPLLLPEQVTVDLASLTSQVSFFFEPARGDPRAVGRRLNRLREAIGARRVVRLRYYTASRDQETVRLVEPYHLRYYDGAWYVAGYCRWRRAVRTFAVDRIRELEVLEETFPPPTPDRFSPETYFGEAWRLQRGAERQQVVVRFRPEQARYMRGRIWHPSQESRDEPDGSLVLSFRVLGTDEIMRWLLQFGASAQVLAPPSLREAIAAEAEAMLAEYRVRGDGRAHPEPEGGQRLGKGR